MTREELKAHCQRQIEGCEMWAKHHGEEPQGKVYEEHKLILELLEQESVIDKIYDEVSHLVFRPYEGRDTLDRKDVLQIIEKYKIGSEQTGNDNR